MTAIAGVFLAAAFAWARELPPAFTRIDVLIVCVTMACLVLSVGCALYSMLVKVTELPPNGRVTREFVEDAVGAAAPPATAATTPALPLSDIEDFYRTLMNEWERANKALASSISDKAEMVFCSQALLFWAAGFSFILGVRALTGAAT